MWLYYRFGLSLRGVSELMLARGIGVSHETIRLWTLRFGLEYARRLRRTRGACSNISTIEGSARVRRGSERELRSVWQRHLNVEIGHVGIDAKEQRNA